MEGVVLGPEGPLDEDLLKAVEKWVQAELAEEPEIPLRMMEDRMKRSFWCEGPLLARLGGQSYHRLLSKMEGISVVGRHHNSVVRRVSQREVGRLRSPVLGGRPEPNARKADLRSRASSPAGSRAGKPKELSVAAVTAETLRVMQETEGHRMKATHLGDVLTELFPGSGKLAHRLGYNRLSEFLISVPELKLVGTEAALVVQLRRSSTRQAASPTQDSPLHREYRLDEVKRTVMRLVKEAEDAGAHITSNALGKQLAELFPGAKKIHKVLGFATLVSMLENIPAIVVEGSGPTRLIKLRQPA